MFLAYIIEACVGQEWGCRVEQPPLVLINGRGRVVQNLPVLRQARISFASPISRNTTRILFIGLCHEIVNRELFLFAETIKFSVAFSVFIWGRNTGGLFAAYKYLYTE
jgi:hypothetical protein